MANDLVERHASELLRFAMHFAEAPTTAGACIGRGGARLRGGHDWVEREGDPRVFGRICAGSALTGTRVRMP